MTLKKKSLENIVGKREDARNQHFLLFPQSFLSVPRISVLMLHLFCRLQMLSIWTSLEFGCLVKSKMYFLRGILILSGNVEPRSDCTISNNYPVYDICRNHASMFYFCLYFCCSDSLGTVINNLQPYTWYFMSIRSKTENVAGPYSRPVLIQTLEGSEWK